MMHEHNALDKWRNTLFSRENLLHLTIWLGFSLLFNAGNFSEHGLLKGLIRSFGTFVFLLWVVFAHLKWALPHLLSSPRNYVSYGFKLVVVLVVCLAISVVTTTYLRDSESEFGTLLATEPFVYACWVSFEALMIMLMSSLVMFSFNFFKLQAQQNEIENQKLEVELKYLKLQINPHFLFNTLNNLLLLTNKKSPKASIVVEKLAYMMRYLLEKDKKDSVPLAVEIEFLKSYIELEQIRIKDIDVSFDIEGEIIGQQLPPALLMTLIENAFKHGVRKSSMDNFVHIELRVLSGGIHLKVTNPFHSKTTPKEFEGIGLENLKKRLHLIYGDDHVLKVGKTGDGTFEASLECATL